MKLPGMGDVKNKNVAIGAGVVGGIVLYAYIKRKRQQTSAGTTTPVDPNAIDPNTGVPYGQEAGSGGGYYTNASQPGTYVSQTGTATTGTTGTYTSNSQWESDALQDAQNYFGASYGLATGALGKYLSQDSKGLSDNEYTVVSEVVALIGQPPVGGPFRLIHGSPAQNPSGGDGGNPEPEPSPAPEPPPPPPPPPPTPAPPPADYIPPGYHMQDPQVATLDHGTSLRSYARYHYPIDTLTHFNRLVQLNPTLNPDDTSHPTFLIRVSDAHLVPNI